MDRFILKIALFLIFILFISCGGDRSTAKFTGKDLDLYATNNTFLVITRPDGSTMYTRPSSFVLDANGYITTSAGFLLSPPIVVPLDARTIVIDHSGRVNVTSASSSSPLTVGILSAVRFPEPDGLQSISGGFYEETPSSGLPESGTFSNDNFGEILQGYLEQ